MIGDLYPSLRENSSLSLTGQELNQLTGMVFGLTYTNPRAVVAAGSLNTP